MRLLKVICYSVLFLLLGCHSTSVEKEQLNLAESLLETDADSALFILENIDNRNLTDVDLSARYSLLLSMAYDKNFIDTTTFDVLQPALDYYLSNGTKNDKLRTYYYQGRIYQNAQDSENAMLAFVKGRAVALTGATDSLTLARLLVAQGVIYYKSFKFEPFISNNLEAAALYRRLDLPNRELACYVKAIEGCAILENQSLADSVMQLCNDIAAAIPDADRYLTPYIITYLSTFGQYEEIENYLDNFDFTQDLSDETIIDLAIAYSKIHNYKLAKSFLEVVDSTYNTSLKYLASKAEICERLGSYEEALDAYKMYFDIHDSINIELYNHNLQFADKQHTLELEVIKEKNHKKRILNISVSVIVFGVALYVILYYRYKLSKAQHLLAQKERENLMLEKKELRHIIQNLETECHRLNGVLSVQQNLSEPVKNAIKERIEMLNALLATEITANNTYSKPYEQWIESIVNNKDNFMDSTRLAFKASHPNFIEYLESHNLTVQEINYLCLYAIGLRGKEVGEYIQLKRHYHISSDIRKKLGLSEHETNISIYVRNLLQNL